MKQSSKALFLSLHPMSAIGGGETYTLNALKSCIRSGITCDCAAIGLATAPRLPNRMRAATRFVMPVINSNLSRPIVLTWSSLLDKLGDYDLVWTHQYLASAHTFDLIAAQPSHAPLLFTNHGCEPLLDIFNEAYQDSTNHFFVEVSPYAINRLTARRSNIASPGAGVWRANIRKQTGKKTSPDTRKLQVIAIGRLLPHKGLEHTIRAIAPIDTLHIAGDSDDEQYKAYLKQLAVGKNVIFHGKVTQPAMDSLLAAADVLVASSHHTFYDGRTTGQPELLGLVLLEAISAGLPVIASSIPAFKHVMNDTGFADFLYPESDSHSLRDVLDRLRNLPADTRRSLISAAQEIISQRYSWDDYWMRVCKTFHRE